jgi:hypothetical protein
VSYQWAKAQWTVPLFESGHVIYALQRLLFAVFSVIANCFILFYHWTNPPHPKFTVLKRSRYIIRAHLLSGTINVALPVVAFCTTNKDLVTSIIWITVAFDVVHLLTVIAQTPNVNGQRNLIVPAYQFIAAIKFVSMCGLVWAARKQSLYSIERLDWLWTVWANHQTYAWVRVWIVFLEVCQACKESRYTVAVIVAGTIGAGQAYGFMPILGLLLWVLAYHSVLERNTYKLMALYREGKTTRTEVENKAMQCELQAMLQFFHEAHHSLYNDNRYKARTSIAQQVLVDGGYIKTVVDDATADASIEFAPLNTIPHEVQALCIFKTIDVDGSGELDLTELAQVFICNGVSIEQTTAMCKLAFTKYDTNDDGVIDLDEFTAAFQAYYLYQFNDLYYILRNSGAMLKNIINATLHEDYRASGCPFAGMPMDYDTKVLDWVRVVQDANRNAFEKAVNKVRKGLSRTLSATKKGASNLVQSFKDSL